MFKTIRFEWKNGAWIEQLDFGAGDPVPPIGTFVSLKSAAYRCVVVGVEFDYHDHMIIVQVAYA